MRGLDGCRRLRARPSLAMRRNAEAVAELAAGACAAQVRLLLVSTNEVFDGERDDGRGYVEDGCDGPTQRLRAQQAGRGGGGAPRQFG